MNMLHKPLSRSLPVLILAGALAQEKPARTVLDGVYTEAQAKRGEAQYGMNCAKCHEGADVDGPPLTGDPFIDRWREDSLATLYNFIRTQMPRDTPGKLTEPAYRDILSFLLAANEFPAGSAELTTSSLGGVELVGKDGPKPLPTNALVMVAGCLAPGEKDTWKLTNATRPARTRTADATTPEELKNSASRPLADQEFALQDLAGWRPGFAPATYRGHKVQVKGVLIRQANQNRIHVTSFESVAEKCP